MTCLKFLSPLHRALAFALVLSAIALPGFSSKASAAAKPLRVFIRAGEKSAAPANHDYPQFLEDWTRLLTERGASASGALRFPTSADLANTDVLILYASNATDVPVADRKSLESFLRNGGGLIVLHDSLCTTNATWLTELIGGAASLAQTNRQPGRFSVQFGPQRHPITEGISPFDLDDETFSNLTLAPNAQILARAQRASGAAFPQMWTFEKRRSRVFASVLGHTKATFQLPQYRGILLRAIAWAARREVDSLTRPDELDRLRYSEGGPTSPAKAAAKLQINPEFTLSLIASEPLIASPTAIDWDAHGRLWATLSPDFANKPAKGKSRDSIVILEDSNGDGIMDKRTVFADGLVRPTAFAFWKDGVIVVQSTEIIWIHDRNADDKADRREVLFSGFSPGLGSTNGTISSLRWGLDGWLYACQGSAGNYSTNITNARGVRFGKIGSGIFRFRPDASAIEQVSAFAGNTSGLDFSDEGEIFFSKAAGPHIGHVVMPERFLAKGNVGKTSSEKSIEDHPKLNAIFTDPLHEAGVTAGGNAVTAASGSTIYQGGIWPEKYHGSHFVCEPALHVVHEDVISRAESPTFESTRLDSDEFVAGRDAWFRPIQTRVGPDGQMYLVDFYSPSARLDDSRRADDLFGRLYRISNKQQRRQQPYQLDSAPSTDLVRDLQHPNMWVRMTAQRLLMERQDLSIVPALTGLLKTNRFVHVRLHALWTLHHLNSLSDSNLLAGLKDEHPSVLNNALEIVAELRTSPSTNITSAVIKQIKGNTERIRLEALFALASSQPNTETISAVHKLYPDLKDGWSKSIVLGIARQAPTNFIRHSFASDKADSYTELVQTLTEDFLDKKEFGKAEWVLRHTARQTKVSSKIKVAILDAFNKNLPTNALPFTPAVDAAIKELLDTESRSTRIATVPLAVHYLSQGTYADNLGKARKTLLADLSNEKAKDEERNGLISSLVKVTALQPDVIAKVDEVLGAAKPAPEPVQRHFVNEIGAIRNPAVAGVLLRNFDKLKGEARFMAFARLLARPEWTDQLLDAIQAKKIKATELGVIGISRLRTHPDKKVAQKAATILDALTVPPEPDRKGLIAAFEPALSEAPDVPSGREYFIRNCTVCHKFQDKGRHVGPELTGVGVRGASFILTHVLDPNRIVESRFIGYNLITKKGDTFSGLLKSSNNEAVVVANLEGDITIKRSDVESLTSTGRSLMPEFFELLGPKNLRDAIGYITSKTPKGYRAVDLTSAFTADSLHGLFASQQDPPSIAFKQFGVVMVDDIPFNIANPATAKGRNLIVLKGGEGFAHSMPQRVEFPVGSAVRKFYVLGGVAGWGFPYGPPEGHNVSAAKGTLVYDDGKTEEIVWKNGVEFADYSRPSDVPGSKAVTDLTTSGQLRWFSVQPKRKEKISKFILESFNNHVAPAFVAVTAQEE